MSNLTPADLSNLRSVAEAAKQQMLTGPKEWPGRPSAQRLALFLAATPDVVLELVRIAEGRQLCASTSTVPRPGSDTERSSGAVAAAVPDASAVRSRTADGSGDHGGPRAPERGELRPRPA